MSIEPLLQEAEQTPLVGWDVTFAGRISSIRPWHFAALVAAHARDCASLLDLGTGGGEWLSALPHRPTHTVATEGWPPNVAIARERLAPLGIEVLEVEAAPPNDEQGAASATGFLPMPDASFELVTSRHESYLPGEVGRVLAPRGHFFTQQVGSGTADDFCHLLGRPAPKIDSVWDLRRAVEQLERAGLSVVDGDEGFEDMTFTDVGALAWYLRKVPFVMPDFMIGGARGALERIHAAREPITIRQPTFWLRARKG